MKRLALLSALIGALVAAHPAGAESDEVESSEEAVAVPEAAPQVEPAMAARLACIARVESHNDPNATNRYSGAGGLYQFLQSTWMTTPQGKAGYSRYDPVAATAAAEWMIRNGRAREWIAVTGWGC